MLAEPLAVTLLVIEVFKKLGVPYLIGGSLASALYGTARATLDTDLVADFRFEHVRPFTALLADEFYVDSEMILDAVQHCSSFNIIHLTTMFKVDVFILKNRPFDQVQFQRRRIQVITPDSEHEAYVTTAEDIVLAKLEWYHMGGKVSDRQWRDVLGVLKVQAGRLDLDYLHKWAIELHVADLLQKALTEVE
ncbi:MAG: hypothetical protein JXA78_14140 [Anaerolineales bacterium]|nr:hypothetical protein [Anaerolineales bacterium]